MPEFTYFADIFFFFPCKIKTPWFYFTMVTYKNNEKYYFLMFICTLKALINKVSTLKKSELHGPACYQCL